MKEKSSPELLARRITKALGITLLVIAAVLLVLSFLLHLDKVQEKYAEWQVFLEDFELRVASLQDKWLIVVVLFLLFLLRCLLPAYPLSAVLVISGIVFNPWGSFAINMGGMALGFCVRYYTGLEMGEGYTLKMLKHYPILDTILEKNGQSNTVLMFLFRLFPGVPVNSVSQIYGSLHFPFKKYMLISMLGIAPSMVIYSFIGKNASDPLSPSFLAPIIVLLTLSGISLLGLHAIITLTMRIQQYAENKKALRRSLPQQPDVQ